MTDSFCIATWLAPLIQQIKPRTMLLAGERVTSAVLPSQDTRLQYLTTPFKPSQLTSMTPVDLAVISDLAETLTVAEGQQWLGMLRNLYAPHILLIVQIDQAQASGWQLADFLAMGLQRLAGNQQGVQMFSYALEHYQPVHDWLNSRFWANPENFGKYWW